MNNIDVGVVDQIAIEVVALYGLAQTLLREIDTLLKVQIIYVAHGYQTALLVARKVVLAETDTTHTDDTLGQLVVGSDVSLTSEYTARNDGQRGQSTQRF